MDIRRPARWRDQPLAARLTLLVIAGGTTALLAWNLGRGGDFSFYQASARSMSESWPALFSGAFDPSATVTLDKLSGFAVPQALSLRLFGHSTAALAFPQVVEGLVTLWACSLVGLRWAGVGTGLVAAAAAGSTPVFVSMFAHPMEDGMVTAALAVALLCWQHAALTGRWWPLVTAGLAVGVGFQAKMVQAWFVLPALLLGTLLASARYDGGSFRFGTRVVRAGVLGIVAVLASVSWVTALALTPSGSRPWADGSTDDSPLAMVFGYNGIDRFLPGAVPGSVRSFTVPFGPHTWRGGPAGFGKLLGPHLASQVAWLLPAAVFGVVVAAVVLVRRRAERPGALGSPFGHAFDTRAGSATLAVLVVWLGTAAAVLSVAAVPHTAYVAAIGVQLALLAALGWRGAVGLVRAQARGLRALPVVLAAAQLGWVVFLARGTAMPSVLAVPAIAVSTVAVVATLVAVWWRPRWEATRGPDRHRASRTVIALAAGLALVAGPAAFSLQALDATRDGSGVDASVGPWPARWPIPVGSPDVFHVSRPDPWGGSTPYPRALSRLVATARRLEGYRHDEPLFMTDTWHISAPVIDATGLPVLTDGGFSGTVPVFTTHQIRRRIADGLRVLVVEAHAPRTDPVLRAALVGGCRALTSGTRHARLPMQPRRADGIAWTVWHCGLPGPSVGPGAHRHHGSARGEHLAQGHRRTPGDAFDVAGHVRERPLGDGRVGAHPGVGLPRLRVPLRT
ncbi:4-amino-4-deoxy-L-arabinose transferase [Curtobacterium sp. MCLR17_051]|nr:4-amino-4-deoxy-L-arabinose transferase [Curtobacterium sp. MCLR17_053]PZF52587.1 4-amino-4-deoxy-L-arabinose transferase [Curtobacterium sp. MCLR17_051]